MKIALQLKADLHGITGLQTEDQDFRWFVKLKCCNCGEETHGEHFQYISQMETSEMTKGDRGSANFVMKCKLCGRTNNSIDILADTLKSYDAEDSGTFKTVVVLECRGIEPVAFEPRNGWIAKGAETTTAFEDISLTEDWCDFDDKASAEVHIFSVEARCVKA